MEGRYYDGLTSWAQPVDVALEADALTFRAGDAQERWPFDALEVERLGEQLRLSRGGDERLVVASRDWRAQGGPGGRKAAARSRRKELKLVAGLVLAGAAIAAFAFVGMPAASGPLARMTPPAFERRIGDSFDAQLALALKPCAGTAGQQALAGLGHRLQGAIRTPFDIRVRAVQAPMVNAFALPGGRVIVTDQLIAMAQTPDELSAVIAHETAHVEKRHVMQAVWRSLGLGMALDALVGGGSGAGQQAVILAGNFADLRFSRQAEAEADARGMEILQASGLSSEGMAPFFDRLAAKGEGPQAAEVRELISSHPDTLRRARVARAHARPGTSAFDAQDWAAVKAACGPPRKPAWPFAKPA